MLSRYASLVNVVEKLIKCCLFWMKQYEQALNIVCDVARTVFKVDNKIPYGANAVAWCRLQVLNFVMYAVMPEVSSFLITQSSFRLIIRRLQMSFIVMNNII
jgi:hypothetical protein